MKFSFKPKRTRHSADPEQRAFQVARLWKHEADQTAEISHLVDRTFAYSSVRELRWHLADRFACPAQSLVVKAV
jgi:hypothetical protein